MRILKYDKTARHLGKMLVMELKELPKQAICDATPQSFDAFCEVLDKSVRDLCGDPRYENARMRALEQRQAEAIAAVTPKTPDEYRAVDTANSEGNRLAYRGRVKSRHSIKFPEPESNCARFPRSGPNISLLLIAGKTCLFSCKIMLFSASFRL
jgi:hypothetical protein